MAMAPTQKSTEAAADGVSRPLHPALDVHRLPQQGADDHTHDDAEGVVSGDHAGDADPQHAQAQGKGEARGKAAADPVFEDQAQGASQEDQDDIDNGGDHGTPYFRTAQR